MCSSAVECSFHSIWISFFFFSYGSFIYVFFFFLHQLLLFEIILFYFLFYIKFIYSRSMQIMVMGIDKYRAQSIVDIIFFIVRLLFLYNWVGLCGGRDWFNFIYFLLLFKISDIWNNQSIFYHFFDKFIIKYYPGSNWSSELKNQTNSRIPFSLSYVWNYNCRLKELLFTFC